MSLPTGCSFGIFDPPTADTGDFGQGAAQWSTQQQPLSTTVTSNGNGGDATMKDAGDSCSSLALDGGDDDDSSSDISACSEELIRLSMDAVSAITHVPGNGEKDHQDRLAIVRAVERDLRRFGAGSVERRRRVWPVVCQYQTCSELQPATYAMDMSRNHVDLPVPSEWDERHYRRNLARNTEPQVDVKQKELFGDWAWPTADGSSKE